MKKVKLVNMHLVNFRGHKDLSIDFSDQTTISGDNRLGKSTVFDAFIWLLFGKDQFDRKDFEIIPVIDGKKLDRVDPEVSATINVDGREMNLKRVLHQKWVRRRGTSEEVFDGCDTLYYHNDVPMKASEFKARVDMIIEESVFKLITNPAAFLSLHWTKQREFLFQMAGTISDAEIASSDPRFSALLEMISGKKLEEFKRELSARKKKLNADLENIQPRIDQTTRLMPEAQDWAKIEADIAKIDEEIKTIDGILSNDAARNRKMYESIQEKQGDINVLKNKQMAVLNNAKSEARDEAFRANGANEELRMKYAQSQQKCKMLTGEVEHCKKQAENIDRLRDEAAKELERLREQWDAENAKEYEEKTGCLTCPAFGHECNDANALEKHAQQADKARESFIQEKARKLDEITKKGKEVSETHQSLTNRVIDAEKYLDEAKDNLAKATEEMNRLQQEVNAIKTVQPREVIASELPIWQECEEQIKKIGDEIFKIQSMNEPSDTLSFTNAKAEYITKRDQLKKQLINRELIERYKKEVKDLEAEGSKLSQQIADLENQEFTIADFTRARIEECDRRINGLFEIVRFKLFDTTNDGNEFEACIPTNIAGVPIAVTNTAEKINAGLDIIRTLSTFYNVSAPIFCDGAESVNRYTNTGSQMIFLRVTHEALLTISNN